MLTFERLADSVGGVIGSANDDDNKFGCLLCNMISKICISLLPYSHQYMHTITSSS